MAERTEFSADLGGNWDPTVRASSGAKQLRADSDNESSSLDREFIARICASAASVAEALAKAPADVGRHEFEHLIVEAYPYTLRGTLERVGELKDRILALSMAELNGVLPEVLAEIREESRGFNALSREISRLILDRRLEGTEGHVNEEPFVRVMAGLQELRARAEELWIEVGDALTTCHDSQGVECGHLIDKPACARLKKDISEHYSLLERLVAAAPYLD
jgi:hypothetical protein